MVDFVDVSSEALTVGGGGITTNLRLLDLERVEIVKGPQSALYGRSAFTGAINYVTRRPTDTLTGDFIVAAEDFGTTDISAMSLSGPLGDASAASIMLNKYDTDGWYENPNTGGQLGAVRFCIGGSLALEWDISEKMTSFFRARRIHGNRSHAACRSARRCDGPELRPDDQLPRHGLGDGRCSWQFPHEFPWVRPVTRSTVHQPYFDSFGLGPTCRPLNRGRAVHATEADIDLSADPRTGNDFLGSTVDTLRVHFDIDYGVRQREHEVHSWLPGQRHVHPGRLRQEQPHGRRGTVRLLAIRAIGDGPAEPQNDAVEPRTAADRRYREDELDGQRAELAGRRRSRIR